MMTEQDKLVEAVDAFAAEMKRVLLERANQGKRGWDGAEPSDYYIGEQMHQDTWYFTRLVTGEKDQLTRSKRAVDIANRAMILWYRHALRTEAAPK